MVSVAEIDGGSVPKTRSCGGGVGARVIFSLAAICVTIVVLSMTLAHVGNAMTAPLAFRGVRLGLAPSDVRARFELVGTWTALPTDELTLLWSSSDPKATVRAVRFEFHHGSLVAARGHVTPKDELARGEALRKSDAALLVQHQRPDGDLDVLLIARDCPTHAREVEMLLGEAR